MAAGESNWPGAHRYAGRIHRPRTLEQVQEIVAGASGVRALVSRHSFNDMADAAELVSLAALPGEVEVDVRRAPSVPARA